MPKKLEDQVACRINITSANNVIVQTTKGELLAKSGAKVLKDDAFNYIISEFHRMKKTIERAPLKRRKI